MRAWVPEKEGREGEGRGEREKKLEVGWGRIRGRVSLPLSSLPHSRPRPVGPSVRRARKTFIAGHASGIAEYIVRKWMTMGERERGREGEGERAPLHYFCESTREGERDPFNRFVRPRRKHGLKTHKFKNK